MDLAAMLAGAMGEHEDKRTPVKDVLDEAQDFVKRYHEKEEFQAGDLVVWKDGMKNVKVPKYGEPIVVLEMFAAFRHANDGTPYGGEPDDMKCIVFKDSEGDLDAYTYDSHRFTKYKG
jgi:hypothetical protein